MRRTRWLLAALAMLLVACAPTGRVVDVGEAPLRAGAASQTTTGDPAADGDRSDTSATATSAQPGRRPVSPVGLAGEPVDWPYPADDAAEVGVVGVEAGDVLNVRAGPGPDQRIVRRLAPTTRGLVFVGNARRVGDAVWHEIRVDRATGWVHGRYVQLVAGTDDITSQVVGDGPAPTARTVRALADVVVDAYGLSDGHHIVWGPVRDGDIGAEDQRRIVISDGPRAGDVHEITLDVLDLYDDAVAAERLVVFARPAADGEGVALSAVERTFFCWRGGADVCV